MIEIDGKLHEVLDSLGWQPSAGVRVKEVVGLDGEPVMAVKSRGGAWRLWAVEDRLRG